MIPDDVVNRVREEADIVAIIGEFVKLKRVGNSFRGPCPFHHGRNPNFSVTDRGYNCFKCGESGSVFTFVQKHLGMDFVEAVKWVGAKAGIEVRETSRRLDEERDPREPLWELNASAAEFFREQLWGDDGGAGSSARAYLASRGLSRDDADRFGLGFAPRDPAAMRQALETLGFADARQLAAGLLVAREDAPTEPRARFRDRVMIPIYDVGGHVVGFGGRILRDGEPKYLNSAESEIFSKRKLLYGLNWAKQAIRKADRLIVVEGYFDVIRLMLAGITEVVAPLGTALTEQQAALIRKYTKNVFLLYDSDQAGLKATFRAGDELLANGMSVRVITLPEGDDPDTFVARLGAEGLERSAAASVDVFDRKIQILERSGRFKDLRRKREAIDKLLPTIRATSDRLLRDLYVSRTAEVAGVSKEVIARELAGQAKSPAASKPTPSAAERRANQPDRRHVRIPPATTLLERELIRIMLRDRHVTHDIAEKVDPTDFQTLACRRIFTELVAADPNAPLDELTERLDESAVALLQELLERNRDHYIKMDHPDEVAAASLNKFLSRSYRQRSEQIDVELPLAPDEEKLDLIREKDILRRKLADLGAPVWKAGKFSST